MTNPTTVTKWAIINNNLHGSYEFLKGRSSYQTNNRFLWVYKYESSNGKEVSSSSLQTYSKSLDLLRKTLTSPSEGLWLANPSLLWLSYLLLQDSPTTFRSTAPEIFSPLISEELSVGAVCGEGISGILSSAISFTDKGLKWFRQDQGLRVQALKKVGTPPVIPIATVNQRLPCNHLLSNMCSPWLPPWQS